MRHLLSLALLLFSSLLALSQSQGRFTFESFGCDSLNVRLISLQGGLDTLYNGSLVNGEFSWTTNRTFSDDQSNYTLGFLFVYNQCDNNGQGIPIPIQSGTTEVIQKEIEVYTYKHWEFKGSQVYLKYSEFMNLLFQKLNSISVLKDSLKSVEKSDDAFNNNMKKENVEIEISQLEDDMMKLLINEFDKEKESYVYFYLNSTNALDWLKRKDRIDYINMLCKYSDEISLVPPLQRPCEF